MNEQLNEVIMFANQNPSCWLATNEDDQPRVRGMLLWFADETGFYFHTGRVKNLYHQITKHPKVEAAFIRNADQPDFETLRVAGTMEVLEDEELEQRLFLERPWLLDNLKRAQSDSDVAIFRIINGTATIWNMNYNLKENSAPKVSF